MNTADVNKTWQCNDIANNVGPTHNNKNGTAEYCGTDRLFQLSSTYIWPKHHESHKIKYTKQTKN